VIAARALNGRYDKQRIRWTYFRLRQQLVFLIGSPPETMNLLRSPFHSLFALVVCCLPLVAFCADNSSPDARPPATRRQVKITISKETTYLVEPIRPDGWIDYAAAINERCKSGVTVENNAAIPFWRAVGPKDIPAEKRSQFFKTLGIASLPNDGHYLVELADYSEHAKAGPAYGTEDWSKWYDNICCQSRIAQSRPWSGKEFPILADWLDANAEPLQILCAGAGRTRFFQPFVVKTNGSLLEAFDISDVSAARCAVELLRLRSTREVTEAKIDAAWRDLLVCHRLVRLLGQKPLLVDRLVAGALEQRAFDGDVAFVHSAAQTSERLRQYHRELSELPGMPPMEGCFLGERLFSLDLLRHVAVGDPEALRVCGGFLHDDRTKQARERLLADSRIDWDLVFRRYNSGLDEVERTWREPTIFLKRQALKKLDEAASDAANRVNDPTVLARFLSPRTTREDLSRQLAEILLDSDGAGSESYARLVVIAAAKAQLTNFAFALAEYHNDHAAYPCNLAELSPKYLSEVPKDPCSDRDYCYRPRENGYLLYSIGLNGKDDCGTSSTDDPKKYLGEAVYSKIPDDIVIRSP